MSPFTQSYALPEADLVPPRPSVEDKLLHGRNVFIAGGDVSVTPEGLLLRGTAGPAWASPQLWSGLKNVRVTTTLRVEQAGDDAVFGIKFGRTWDIVAEGPRLALQPAAKTIGFPGAGDAAVGLAEAAIPRDEWFELSGCYSFDEESFSAESDGREALRVAMPHEPFEDFMRRFGRPAPVTGIGVFAQGCDVRVREFSFVAGAPQRRVVVIGDSITQHAYWVNALEAALGEEVTNLGIGGDSARMMAMRFDRDVLPLRPGIAIIAGGSNDIGWGATPQEVARGFLAPMVRRARTAGVRPILAEILPRRGYKTIPEFNAEIRKLAEDEEVPLLAWYAPTLDAQTGEMKPGYAPDGAHPVRLGGEAMVKAIDLSVLRG